MSLDWNAVHVEIYKPHNTLFIGKFGVHPQTKKFCCRSRSDNRTEEIITVVAQKMRCDIDRQNNADKPYTGYNVPGVGKLVLIKDGFDFYVTPAPRKTRAKST